MTAPVLEQTLQAISTTSAPRCWAARWCRWASPSTASTSWCASRRTDECRAAIGVIEARAAIARRERGVTWAFGADELYVRAGVELPPASLYDGFEQVENGVGAVRWLQRQIANEAESLGGWRGKRVGVVTGTAMAPLMPQVIAPLTEVTGAVFELIPVENTLFGTTVTTAGLIPGVGDAGRAARPRATSTWCSCPPSRSTTTGSSSIISRSTS